MKMIHPQTIAFTLERAIRSMEGGGDAEVA